MRFNTFTIKDELVKIAKEEAKKIPKNIKNSIRKGEGRVHGVIGEFVASSKYAYGGKRKNTYDYDIILPDGRTADAKTKFIKRDIVLPEYDCSIYAQGKFQKCDLYIFLRYFEEERKMYLLGAITKDEFYRKAIFRKKGEVDPKSPYGWKYKWDCYNMEIRDLIPFGEEI